MLTVSPDEGVGELREAVLRRHSIEVGRCSDVAEAQRLMAQSDWHLLLLGYQVSREDCLEIVNKWETRFPDQPIMQMTRTPWSPPPCDHPRVTVASMEPEKMIEEIRRLLQSSPHAPENGCF